jgi:lipopolysaccharide export system protein LptC
VAADSRSRIVGFLKVALALAALGLTALVFLVGRERGDGLSLSGLDFGADGGLRLSNPQFTGRTPDGAPFSVTAEWALPDGPDPEHVELGPVTGEARLAADRTLFLEAAGGEARPKDETVALGGGVTVRSSDGYVLTVDNAMVRLQEQTLEAAGPVEGLAPFGDLSAGSMRAARIGESAYIWFEDGVRVRIDPERAPERGE